MQSRFSYLIPTRNRDRKGCRPAKNERLLAQTDGRCAYCAKPLHWTEATRDHVVPRAKGGKTKLSNLRVSCQPCNQRKADLDLEEFRDLYFGGGVFWFEVIESAA